MQPLFRITTKQPLFSAATVRAFRGCLLHTGLSVYFSVYGALFNALTIAGIFVKENKLYLQKV